MKERNKEEKLENDPSPEKTIESLKALVQQHKICWEVFPEQIPVKEDKPLPVGFNLILYGAHSREDHPVPGCEKCLRIVWDLKKIAKLWVKKRRKKKSGNILY